MSEAHLKRSFERNKAISAKYGGGSACSYCGGLVGWDHMGGKSRSCIMNRQLLINKLDSIEPVCGCGDPFCEGSYTHKDDEVTP